MDENPYKSPKTRGAPLLDKFGWLLRALLPITVAAFGTPFAVAAIVLLAIGLVSRDLELCLYAFIPSAVAATTFFVVTRMPD